MKQYIDALAKSSNDPDLMLRVGCGQVAAGRADQAEELLKKVLSQRPTSAETNHCLGRIQPWTSRSLVTPVSESEQSDFTKFARRKRNGEAH